MFLKKGLLQTVRHRGFSLVELLAVITIVMILAGLSASVFRGQQASAVSDSAEAVSAAVREAAQTALVRNEAAALRFYKLPPPDFPAGPSAWRAVQVLCMNSSGTFVPLSKPVNLAKGTILSDQAAFSPMLQNSFSGVVSGTAARVGTASNVPYKQIEFYSNRRTSIPITSSTGAFVSIWRENTAESPPKNFATVTLEPGNSKCQVLRP